MIETTTAASLAQYTAAAGRAASEVIRAYSTSFGAATRLLGHRHRQHVRNIYALVRVADELVDGVAADAGAPAATAAQALEQLIDDTHRAMETGFSGNLIVHAFATTARTCGIDRSLTEPFFASMRSDLETAETPGLRTFDRGEHGDYVYGSAEVVGLMCLRVFTRVSRLSDAERGELERGARQLGAAFQNVNFLRDLADDTARLGRSYLSEAEPITDADRDRWVATIRSQLDEARRTLPLLPADARLAVRSALDLFASLTARIAATPAEHLYRERVRVPGARKALIVVRAVATSVVTSGARR
ncbi:MAG TPA: squalene/phytoene synthase family protein [Terrimesophilobacter sp.]|nr:squalene/phytoene synthase family protein [Terrimesophilobacter sp.]